MLFFVAQLFLKKSFQYIYFKTNEERRKEGEYVLRNKSLKSSISTVRNSNLRLGFFDFRFSISVFSIFVNKICIVRFLRSTMSRTLGAQAHKGTHHFRIVVTRRALQCTQAHRGITHVHVRSTLGQHFHCCHHFCKHGTQQRCKSICCGPRFYVCTQI